MGRSLDRVAFIAGCVVAVGVVFGLVYARLILIWLVLR